MQGLRGEPDYLGEQTYKHDCGGEEGEGGKYADSNMETHMIMCQTESKWEFVLWLRELKQKLSSNLEG